MPSKLVLFGPPAAGKTSTARMIRCLRPNINVLELEEIGSTNDERRDVLHRIAALEHRQHFVATAADLDVRDIPAGVEIILLWPPNRTEYLERAEARDRTEQRPPQEYERIYDLMTQHVLPYVNMKIDTQTNLVEETAAKVIEWLDRRLKDGLEMSSVEGLSPLGQLNENSASHSDVSGEEGS